MKRCELGKLIGKDLSRDEARRRMYSLGLGNWDQMMEMDSPWANAHRDISYTADNGLGQHSHLFYELIFCVQGEVEYLLDTRTVSVSSGDIVFVPPGVVHGLFLREPVEIPYERYVLWVSPVLMEQVQRIDGSFPDISTPVKLATKGTVWEHIGLLFRECVLEEEKKNIGWHGCLIGFAVQIIAHIGRALKEQKPTAHGYKARLQEDILEFIQKNLDKKLSVSETARQFHISNSTLTHMFQQSMGISFYCCVTQRRLLEAKNRIAQGFPMEQISQQVGFSEYSAFYRAFKSEYSISPIQYRQLVQGE